MACRISVFSFIFSEAYCVRSLNWCSVRMFLALARISSVISLNTLSLLVSFASSISSLHALYNVSFMWVLFLPVCFVGF